MSERILWYRDPREACLKGPTLISRVHARSTTKTVDRRGEEIVLRPVVIESKGTKLDRIRKKIKALGLTDKVVDAAIRWARTE